MRKMKKSTFCTRCTNKDLFKDNYGLPLAVYPEYVNDKFETRSLCFDSRYNWFINIDDLKAQCDDLNIKYSVEHYHSQQLDDDYYILLLDNDNFL